MSSNIYIAWEMVHCVTRLVGIVMSTMEQFLEECSELLACKEEYEPHVCRKFLTGG